MLNVEREGTLDRRVGNIVTQSGILRWPARIHTPTLESARSRHIVSTYHLHFVTSTPQPLTLKCCLHCPITDTAVRSPSQHLLINLVVSPVSLIRLISGRCTHEQISLGHGFQRPDNDYLFNLTASATETSVSSVNNPLQPHCQRILLKMLRVTQLDTRFVVCFD